ncbi:hypothetical protein Harman_33190 [Haloarcula mannanilytica]|uniref:Uncharacterized protein n=2 Tax=Haloarcula mannanilytica TaxID=2509225 RepID=A0A4C2ELF8_9EURY|nr:hypothetical protein Harman_33190 [Haloarcula mannanilytica]
MGAGTFTFDVDAKLVLMPKLTTNFKGMTIKWEPGDDSDKSYSLKVGPQKVSLNWKYDPELWTLEIGAVGAYGDERSGGDVYTTITADVDIAQLLVRQLSGGLLKKIKEETNNAVEPMIDGIIGFEFHLGEGNDRLELHQNYADLKLGFKIDFQKLIAELRKTGEAASEGAERGMEEGVADVRGDDSPKRSDEKGDESEGEQPKGYSNEAGVGPITVSSEAGASVEAGAEFHAKTTYGETDEGAVEPTKSSVSTKGYVKVQIGYFTIDLTVWEGEGKSKGTATERQAMRDRALASGIIDAMETVPLDQLRGAATYEEMETLVDALNEKWVTAPDPYIRDARSQLTDPGSLVDWGWGNNYPMLFREVGGTNYFSVYAGLDRLFEIASQRDGSVEQKKQVISRWPGRHGIEINERHRKALHDWQVAVNTAEQLALRSAGGTSRSELLDDATTLKSHVTMMLDKYSPATLKYIGYYETLTNISRLSPEEIVRSLTRIQKRKARQLQSRTSQ